MWHRKQIERTQFVTLEGYLHCLASPRMRAIASNDVLCVHGLNLVFAVLARALELNLRQKMFKTSQKSFELFI